VGKRGGLFEAILRVETSNRRAGVVFYEGLVREGKGMK
jgi:hypothetical protein